MRLLIVVFSVALTSKLAAYTTGQNDTLDKLNRAVEASPKNAELLLQRGVLLDGLGKHKEAVDDFTKALQLDPKQANAYHERGCAYFKLGNFKESVRDFDKYIEQKPLRKASHWQRGISYYYAGQFEDGRRQFEGYQDFDSNDVENAVWRFMCMARHDGMDKARKEILKIGDDRRVPMRQVYELFAGLLKPADVLAAAVAGNPKPELRSRQLFYAHLYVGIYFDLEGNKANALEHLNKAADEHRIDHYMWDVARVHRDLLKASNKK
ncbi:MAG: tetratricopeptide repeat protein [Gemmataceae bacterium]|nr:tetratricopeptide repeat protein [Gemmataceae bacterium]MCI0741639.1 tetratricopeptide repeat protein [Gemmataceae bacterium]